MVLGSGTRASMTAGTGMTPSTSCWGRSSTPTLTGGSGVLRPGRGGGPACPRVSATHTSVTRALQLCVGARRAAGLTVLCARGGTRAFWCVSRRLWAEGRPQSESLGAGCPPASRDSVSLRGRHGRRPHGHAPDAPGSEPGLGYRRLRSGAGSDCCSQGQAWEGQRDVGP